MADIPIDITELERLQSIEHRADEVLIQLIEAPGPGSVEAQAVLQKCIQALTYVKSGERN